jgi:hypothetical protein
MNASLSSTGRFVRLWTGPEAAICRDVIEMLKEGRISRKYASRPRDCPMRPGTHVADLFEGGERPAPGNDCYGPDPRATEFQHLRDGKVFLTCASLLTRRGEERNSLFMCLKSLSVYHCRSDKEKFFVAMTIRIVAQSTVNSQGQS